MTPEEFNSKVQSAVDGIGIAVKYINGECVAKVVKDGKPSLVYLYDSELESGLDDAISTISNQYLRFGVVKTKEDMLEQFADVAIPASPVVTFSGTSNTGSLNTCPQTSSK